MIFEPSKHYRKHKSAVKNEFRFKKSAEILALIFNNNNIKICKKKLSVFKASALFLVMNFIKTLSK